MATLTGTTPMTSTADVIIHVGDQNDHPPTFDRYPSSPVNTTYLVSTRAQRGYVITRLRTSDADVGINSRITYQLADITARDSADASAAGLFQVDRDHGIISVAGSLANRDGVTFDLIVVAMDGGQSPMSAFTTVSILVNSSVVDVPISEADHRRSLVVRQNLLVVVALAVISGLITVCLVVAIVCIRRGDRRRRRSTAGGAKSRKYNCRMETLQLAAADTSHDEPLQSAPMFMHNGGVQKNCEPEITSYCAEQETKMRLSSQVFRPNCRVCVYLFCVHLVVRKK